MNRLEKHIHLLCALPFAALALVALGLYFEVPLLRTAQVSAAGLSASYSCPMHRNIEQAHSGKCRLCGMKLVASASLDLGVQPTVSEAKHDCCSNNKRGDVAASASSSGCTHAEAKCPSGHRAGAAVPSGK